MKTRKTRKDVYAMQGIEYKNEHIIAPNGLPIPELLCNGNEKVGLGVWTWSTLAGNFEYNVDVFGERVSMCGTCSCNCKGCYAQCGFYRRKSVKNALAMRTFLIRNYPDFVRRAIIAQIEADNIELCRVHASGDFDSNVNISVWHNIIEQCSKTRFWTYTKYEKAEHAFDDLVNMNVVPSVIQGKGYNFGPCAYILDLYNTLKAEGKRVYICKCGFNPDQHCVDCKGCSENDYVLFLEHSTGYNSKADPLYNELYQIVMAQ